MEGMDSDRQKPPHPNGPDENEAILTHGSDTHVESGTRPSHVVDDLDSTHYSS
jgi:hypothetical protein